MKINLDKIPYQEEAVSSIMYALGGLDIEKSNDRQVNHKFINNGNFEKNIKDIHLGKHYEKAETLPSNMRTIFNEENYFNIDVKMETGTGKTFTYLNTIFEINRTYKINKFVVVVPSTAIKEGAKGFINAEYTKEFFNRYYPNKKIVLDVLNAGSTKKGKKFIPTELSNFIGGSSHNENKIHVLLLGMGMLKEKTALSRDDYDTTLFSSVTCPVDAIKAQKPVLIIDEPHRFSEDNNTFNFIKNRISPQLIIRFGATFPVTYLGRGANKKEVIDYKNLVYNLDSIKSFNDGLIKGLDVSVLGKGENDKKYKVLNISGTVKAGITAKFRDENTKNAISVSLNEDLSIVDSNFTGISIVDAKANKYITLSNDKQYFVDDIITSSIFGETYQEVMIIDALNKHFETEKKNFKKNIKSIALFFIDNVKSYRNRENEDEEKGHLRLNFEKILKSKLEEEIKDADGKYKEYLEASLKDVTATNGGYFSEDNLAKKDDDRVKDEVQKILKEKDKTINFYNEDGSFNTFRFIFSKWTLREGWDNPNVFTIAKLRSSGSEISKLQEVGRGLRLPVDTNGNRITDDEFFLNYIVDSSEEDFVNKIIKEINSSAIDIYNIKDVFNKYVKDNNIDGDDFFIELLSSKYIDREYNVLLEKEEEFFSNYPELYKGVNKDKVGSNISNKGYVKIRRDNYEKIKDLWEKLNEKYTINFENIDDETLINAVTDILLGGIFKEMSYSTTEYHTTVKENIFAFEKGTSATYYYSEKMNYGEFLEKINRYTSVPVNVFHKAMINYSNENKVDNELFNNNSLNNFCEKFKNWLSEYFVSRYTYQKVNDVIVNKTALTEVNGELKESILRSDIGVRSANNIVPENFLYDEFLFDSELEATNISKSTNKKIKVFGKIPRRSIKVPLFYGGTTSPDFMYVLENENGDTQLNLIIETKDVKAEKDIRIDENIRIQSCKKMFEQMKKDGVNVEFTKQLKSDDIDGIIKKLV